MEKNKANNYKPASQPKSWGMQVISQPLLMFLWNTEAFSGEQALWQWNVSGDVKEEANIPNQCSEKRDAMNLSSWALWLHGDFPPSPLPFLSFVVHHISCWMNVCRGSPLKVKKHKDLTGFSYTTCNCHIHCQPQVLWLLWGKILIPTRVPGVTIITLQNFRYQQADG